MTRHAEVEEWLADPMAASVPSVPPMVFKINVDVSALAAGGAAVGLSAPPAEPSELLRVHVHRACPLGFHPGETIRGALDFSHATAVTVRVHKIDAFLDSRAWCAFCR